MKMWVGVSNEYPQYLFVEKYENYLFGYSIWSYICREDIKKLKKKKKTKNINHGPVVQN